MGLLFRAGDTIPRGPKLSRPLQLQQLLVQVGPGHRFASNKSEHWGLLMKFLLFGESCYASLYRTGIFIELEFETQI